MVGKQTSLHFGWNSVDWVQVNFNSGRTNDRLRVNEQTNKHTKERTTVCWGTNKLRQGINLYTNKQAYEQTNKQLSLSKWEWEYNLWKALLWFVIGTKEMRFKCNFASLSVSMCSMLGRYAEIGLMWATQTQIVERLSRCGGLVVFGWNPTRTLLALLRPDSGNSGARERPNLFLSFPFSVLYLIIPRPPFFSSYFQVSGNGQAGERPNFCGDLHCGRSTGTVMDFMWTGGRCYFGRTVNFYFAGFDLLTHRNRHSMSFESLLYFIQWVRKQDCICIFISLTHKHTATTQRVFDCSIIVFVFVFAIVFLLSDTPTTINHWILKLKNGTLPAHFYRSWVRSLGMLVTHWLTP